MRMRQVFAAFVEVAARGAPGKRRDGMMMEYAERNYGDQFPVNIHFRFDDRSSPDGRDFRRRPVLASAPDRGTVSGQTGADAVELEIIIRAIARYVHEKLHAAIAVHRIGWASGKRL